MRTSDLAQCDKSDGIRCDYPQTDVSEQGPQPGAFGVEICRGVAGSIHRFCEMLRSTISDNTLACGSDLHMQGPKSLAR
ncbi:hypothetical protein J7T55_014251 [Diaporthe amygdali]|uniref:uncharacterized protein n=1 Tax=Phomopsis amygdali TaxID=1214568 RepID=UPI0022FDEE3F|nr:uncharacterized protein J7T55_014251 [Diaporthe amygdali]KAJ0109689.1 hypothetical protein J7T55_014251 [Diaporthe amygdali]